MAEQQQRQFSEAKVEEIVVGIVSPVCKIALLVDDEVTPPFCAYEVTNCTPTRTKIGITGWTADVSIYYVHANEQAATAKKQDILRALATYKSATSLVNIENVVETFEDGYYAWRIEIQLIEKI